MERVFRSEDYVAYGLFLLVDLAALAIFARHWVALPDWSRHPFLIGFATLVLAYRLGGYAVHWVLLPLMRRPTPIPPGDVGRLAVATTFVPAVESFAMLEETVRGLIAMRGSHDTWVLDEGDDERVRELCDKLGARHFTRKPIARYNTDRGPLRARTKYGNYNAWLDAIGYEAYDTIVGFDPDHVPELCFLERTLGYLRDPSVGYVQAAQVYYNQAASFIARGAAEETYAYYATGLMASYALGYPIVTGCHNVHRVEALRQIGGFPAHDADDLLMTMRYRAAGWKGVYVPEVLARGLTPVDWTAYLMQQRRWARSVLDIKLRVWPGQVGRMPVRERIISGLHGLYYFQGATTLIVVLLIGFMAATGVVPRFVSYVTAGRFSLVLLVLMVTDFYRQRFFLDRAREWGLHWRAGVLQMAKWPQLVIATWEVLRDVERPYTVTPKRGVSDAPLSLTRPHLLILLFLGACVATGLVTGRLVHPLVYAGVGILAAVSVLLLASTRLEIPPPYDPALWAEASRRRWC